MKKYGPGNLLVSKSLSEFDCDTREQEPCLLFPNIILALTIVPGT